MTGRLRSMTALYLSRGDRMLLLYRIGSRVVPPSWCGIGGHFEGAEINDARACVLRELKEELCLSESALENLALRYITLRLKNGEVRQNYYFFAELKAGTALSLQCDEGRPEWVDYGDILRRAMPYSARYALEHYLKEGRHTDLLYGGVAGESGVKFTALEEF